VYVVNKDPQTDVQFIQEEVQQFISKNNTTEEEFNGLALKLFAFQYEQNQAFRRYCRKRRVSPVSVSHYSEIPPVPIAAFKETTLSCCPIEEAQAVFMTSGTTNPEQRGKNFHKDLEVYDASMKRHFKDYILPDLEKIKMAVLFPPEKEMPNSSLAHYLQLAISNFGAPNSAYVISDNQFDMVHLIDLLRDSEKYGEPVLIIGATFSFIHFLDHCQQEGIQFTLPQGSRLMDTGGAKGRSREMDPAQLKHSLKELFSTAEINCVNMYGMTELSSQFYDRSLRDDYLKYPIRTAKAAPHWVRTLVVDPETMTRKPQGEQGIIVHYDLANVNSVFAIMTEDLGIETEDGFHLLGRASGAEAKGCSLAVEQFLSSTSGGFPS
jgi:hypothetical protein